MSIFFPLFGTSVIRSETTLNYWMTQILRKRLANPFPTVKSPLYLTKTCHVINYVLRSTTGMSTFYLKNKEERSSLIQIVTIVKLNTIFSVARQNSVASRLSPVHCFPFYSLLLFRSNLLPSRPPPGSIARLLASLLILLFRSHFRSTSSY